MFAVASCQKQPQTLTNESVEANTSRITVSKSQKLETDTKELLDSFTDDSKIGVPRKNKIELSLFEGSKNNVVELKLYSLGKNKEWHLKQTFEFDKFGDTHSSPELKDFNGDGLKDFTYHSADAGRGANDVRKLFLYNKRKDKLVYIRNSEEYPNLIYNKQLNCLNAQLYYGGNATVFLKIDGDSLREFAKVETFGTERKVYLIDRNGKEKLLQTDKVGEDGLFERYKTFNPPKPYTSKELKQ